MAISEETLRESLRAMDSDELLRRWAAQSFSEIATPIAWAEIEARGLKTSNEAIEQLRSSDRETSVAVKQRRGNIYRNFAVITASGFGLVLYRVFGIVVAALAWMSLVLVVIMVRFMYNKSKAIRIAQQDGPEQ